MRCLTYGTGDTMQIPSMALLLTACGTLMLAGCSSDGGLLGGALTTQSIPTGSAAASVATAKADPACHTLMQRIEALRQDGLTERLEKASTGKSATVSVKRASLAQAAELDRANAEFQAKCSTLPRMPVQHTAQVAPHNASQVVPAAAPPVIVQQR